MVYVPLDHAAATRLAADRTARVSRAGHAATPALLAAHDLGAEDAEDADYTALCYAGVAALREEPEGPRLVLAAEVDLAQFETGGTDPYGRVEVRDLRWDQVAALFADEPGSLAAVGQARSLAAGLTLAQALEHPDIDALLNGCDLLWFAPQELDRAGAD